ncbi:MULTISPECIES: DNA polymerase Y family protein [unclassified Caballeronia]|uniref:Y-family DNA polymerase n=1 Tax=unclassified Caballeronia TaxID=2646786 RepID=UPI0028668FE3|nr:MULTISPECIES: DNA polymerase Y family protein [unclassified Caballeronia]MDR5755117.1 DNA polymerase Y family protein [Caballeronia sp. LZ024]MDR5845327.1 DNA polymerase Y family protein [Caballeronia sp. LZ031]
MAVLVAIHLPRLSLEVFRPRWSPRTENGCVVLDRDKVAIADAVAREAGVLLGMKRGGVVTLAPDALVYDRAPVREQDMLREVALALMRFSPMVAVCEEETVVVDVSASLRLFGGILRICHQIRKIVDAVGVSVRMSVAPTGRGAWMLAKRGRRRVLKMRSLERELDSLPYLVVPEIRRFADWFAGLGCRVLEDIRRLPRAGLKKRCSVELLDSLDRAYGLSPELYEWLDVPPTFSARVELPDRVEHAEAILFSTRRLVVQLCGWLSAQQLALTHASVTLEHERGREAIEPTTIDLALAEPTWHEEHLVRLLKERLGRVELPAAVIAVRLTATHVQGAEPPTDTLFPEPGGSAEDHNRLLELLVARLGSENVLRPAPTSDHRPEHANRWVSVQDVAKPETPPCDLPRPTWLLETPLRLMVKNHRPFYGSTLKLVSTGERIEAGWFDGDLAARDYFVAEAADKSCYWIYRERPSATSDEVRWFLHGLFG